MKQGMLTYVATLLEMKPPKCEEVPAPVVEILGEFVDVMPSELSRTLPPRRTIDHKIELEFGARPASKAPYRLSRLELIEPQT